MIRMMDCDEARICIGVYVLGSIDPIERALVDAHLDSCEECRAELSGLAALPALLSKAEEEDIAALADLAEARGTTPGPPMPPSGTPPMALGDTAIPGGTEVPGNIVDLAAARRRRRRWQATGLSAVAAVIIGVAAYSGAEAASGDGNAASPSAAAGLDYGAAVSGWTVLHGTAGGMNATVKYQQMGWGIQIATKVTGIPLGTPCRLIAIGPAGARTVVGGWTTDRAEGRIWYPASAGIGTRQVRGFQITVTGRPTIVIPG
jgi:hypothetical protein